MSVHLILARSDEVEVQSNVVDLIPDSPACLAAQVVLAGTKSRDRWLGVLGLVGVVMILTLSVYSVVRYLL